MFPFSTKLKCNQGFIVDHRDVLEKIGPSLTPDRLTKIKKVVAQRNFNSAVVLENIYDLGNASAVMRSAEGFGFVNFHVIEGLEKFKEGNRTSAGASKWIETTRWKSTEACVAALKSQGKKIIVTHLDEQARPIEEIDFSEPCALVLGNENEGCSKEMLAAADHRVILPMVGFVQSYNISVAAALSFYAMFRQQGISEKFSKNKSFLSEQEQAILTAEYILRTQDSSEAVLKQLLARGELTWTVP